LQLLGGNLEGIINILKKILDQKYSITELSKWILSRRWILLFYMFFVSLFLILLVINVRNVNHMLEEKRLMEKKLEKIKNQNAQLYSKIVYLESAQRIIPYAENNLNMILPNDAPKIILNNNE
jgi:cell division protein FtsB